MCCNSGASKLTTYFCDNPAKVAGACLGGCFQRRSICVDVKYSSSNSCWLCDAAFVNGPSLQSFGISTSLRIKCRANQLGTAEDGAFLYFASSFRFASSEKLLKWCYNCFDMGS